MFLKKFYLIKLTYTLWFHVMYMWLTSRPLTIAFCSIYASYYFSLKATVTFIIATVYISFREMGLFVRHLVKHASYHTLAFLFSLYEKWRIKPEIKTNKKASMAI